MGKSFVEVYPYSRNEAKRLEEIERWEQSHQENIACKNFIEKTIEENYKNNRLHQDSANEVIEQFGYKRTAVVLANSIKEKMGDGRFSRDNKAWAKNMYIPKEQNHLNADFAVDSHPTLLDGFINQYQRAYDKLELFHVSQIDMEDGYYEGKVIAVIPTELSEEYFNQRDQIYVATSGFGCEPDKVGRAVFATCLGDGVRVRWDRSQILGVIKEEYIPEYAKQKLEELGFDSATKQNPLSQMKSNSHEQSF
ncbi:DUF3849 domain-containing protein [Chakrabartyella piscis]|uniref:DUF3849 domain-containing protein n=1 Tax=Chakrabartyella piscis TaxID=2918914 RepID=UPI002958A7A9|nr:DUF3849 domain-containing protein [Chakrabartyella piscis]